MIYKGSTVPHYSSDDKLTNCEWMSVGRWSMERIILEITTAPSTYRANCTCTSMAATAHSVFHVVKNKGTRNLVTTHSIGLLAIQPPGQPVSQSGKRGGEAEDDVEVEDWSEGGSGSNQSQVGFYQSFHSRVIAAASTAITRPQKKRLALATEKQELKMPHSMSVKAVNIDIDPRCHPLTSSRD